MFKQGGCGWQRMKADRVLCLLVKGCRRPEVSAALSSVRATVTKPCLSDSPSSATPRSVFGSGLLVPPRLIDDLPVLVHQPHDVDPNSLQWLQLPLRVDLRTSSKQQSTGISYAADHRKRKGISPAQCRAESGELSLVLYPPLGHSTSLRPRNSLQVARATKGAHLSKTCLCCIREASTKVYGKDEAFGCQRAASATVSLSPLVPTRPVS
ncbi:hypothetical protein MRX96_016024 [Rhipicephalus microplus]